jgi:glycogen synthase
VHDTEPIGDEFQTGPSFRGLIALSAWHRRHLLSAFPMPEQFIRVIGNAIVPIPELLTTPKIPLRFIYSSSPDRGLERLVQCIERLALTMPVSLSVFANEELIDGRTRALMQRAPSRYLVRPRVTKEELHKAYAESDYWLYPTHFQETSCLCAVEAQYYQCVCITTALAALADTVADRGVALKHKAEDPELIDEVVTKIEFLEKHPAIKQLYREKAHEWASKQVMPELGKQWDSLIQL